MRYNCKVTHMPVILVNGEQLGDGKSTRSQNYGSVDGPINQSLYLLILSLPYSITNRARRRKPGSFEGEPPLVTGSEPTHQLGLQTTTFTLHPTHHHALLLVRTVRTLYWDHVQLFHHGVHYHYQTRLLRFLFVSREKWVGLGKLRDGFGPGF